MFQGQLSTEEAKAAHAEAERLNNQAEKALETAQKEEDEAVAAEVATGSILTRKLLPPLFRLPP